MKQTTIKNGFTLSGKGLHTGLNTVAEFCPAPDNHGYKFQRIDVEGQPIIDAVAENVKATTRGTVIGKGDTMVSTIEHTMAALYAAGIDNVLIKVNAPEMPILDGSSRIISDAIIAAGIEEQETEKEFYVVKQKIEVRDDTTGASIIVLPDDNFSIDTMVAFDSPVIPNQFASMDDIDSFYAEISSARTFVFVREIEPLLNANLIKGGDLDNAIVIYDKPMEQSALDRIADLTGARHIDANDFGYLNNRPLEHDNEPARHKLLDVIGDLALIGRPLKGRVIATRPGHYAVTQLFYDNRKYFEFVEQAKTAGINIPIIPGIKPFKKLSQLSMIPKTFKVDLPEDLVKEALKCKNDAEAEQVGIEWCVAQCKELMAHGVPSIHFYSIGAVDSIKEVAKIIY